MLNRMTWRSRFPIYRGKAAFASVVNVMKEHGLDPSAQRREKTWSELVRMQAANSNKGICVI
jgi:hypothetical protein